MRKSNRSVLLIEPNQTVALQCRKFLESSGYQVFWCKNAQYAINAADTRKPDVVVLELLLAAHSGVEFLYEFRSYNEWRNVPVVIFSRISRADVPASDKILEELGVSSYLYKPETSLTRLCERLDVLLPQTATKVS